MDSDNSTGTIPNLTFSDEQQYVLNNINDYTNIPALVCAFLVLVIVVAMRLYDRKLVDRVSLRLNTAISATDMVKSVALMIYTYELISPGGFACKLVPFLIVWLTNQYVLLTTSIAHNLLLIFLLGKPFKEVYEKWYFILPIGAAFLSALIPLLANRFGFDVAQGACWYTPSYTALSQRWEYGTFLVPVMAGMTYCTIVFIATAIKLYKENREISAKIHSSGLLDDMSNSVDVQRYKTTKAISRVVRRIILYIIIPLSTMLGFIVSEVWMYYYNEISYALNVWSVFTMTLPGILNFLAFLLDPAVQNAFEVIKYDLVNRYGDKPFVTPGTDSGTTASTLVTDQLPLEHSSKPTERDRPLLRWFVRTFIAPKSQSNTTLQRKERLDKAVELSAITTSGPLQGKEQLDKATERSDTNIARAYVPPPPSGSSQERREHSPGSHSQRRRSTILLSKFGPDII
ncbi:hypothetical protein BC937DRAFT_87835 [Endogone sp. FLAS-F59071]|nr:hypothetical protein BC937DRAFT_87835 [Endogone sp. FLAS-F59071]|eukprot:RUS19201.1 hypothetical protein BC937DRAFT_87835 [Endogone sp. FLAS-F59071]